MIGARRLSIHGRVQGVGFRQSMRSEAERLGVSGWVRNRRDGSVEAVVCGTEKTVQAIIEWAREGPVFSRVEHVEVEEIQLDIPAGFFVISTD